MDQDGLTEYERERAENIRKNAELLSLLNVQGIHDDLGIPEPVTKSKSKSRARSSVGGASAQPRVKKERVPEAPLRRSTRGKPERDETPGQKRKRELEEEEKRKEEDREREGEREKERQIKKARKEAIGLAKLANDAPQVEGLNEELSALCLTSYPRQVSSHSKARDDELKSDAKLEEVRGLARKAVVRSLAKVSKERIYCAAYHPETSKDIIFVGDKVGQMGIWEPLAVVEKEEEEEDPNAMPSGRFWQLQMHYPASSKSSISAMKFDPIDAHSIFSSAYDCTIRRTTFASDTSKEVFRLDGALISSFDIPTHGNELWISDVHGCISHVDLREDGKSMRRWDVNGDGTKIGCISVNPVSSHFLITASNNRALKLWDARKLTSLPVTSTPPAPKTKSKRAKSEEEDSNLVETDFGEVSKYLESNKGKGLLRAQFDHKLSASSAYWDPSGRRIVSTSYDDNIRMWDVPPSTLHNDAHLANFKPIARKSHNCQTGRWLTILRAQWMPSPEVYPHFVVANMNQSLDVVGCRGEDIASLRNPNRVTAVQAVAVCHPSIVGRYVTGNASGRCILWGSPE